MWIFCLVNSLYSLFFRKYGFILMSQNCLTYDSKGVLRKKLKYSTHEWWLKWIKKFTAIKFVENKDCSFIGNKLSRLCSMEYYWIFDFYGRGKVLQEMFEDWYFIVETHLQL